MTKTIEVDAEVVKAISEEVTKSIQPQIDELKTGVDAAKADIEKSKLATDEQEAEVLTKYDKMSKEAFTLAQVSACLNKNGAELQELNAHALKTLEKAGYVDIEKATYLNAGTTADGGAFVPNASLLEDVFSVLSNYSSIAGLGREITLTEGDSLDVATLTADVVMTEVGSEGGDKGVTKPTIGDGNVAVREFAGIAILTKKLLRQSAIDVYAVIRDSFARAIAKKREELTLTDSTSGIVSKSGVVVKTLASTKVAVADFTWKDIKGMPFLVPVASAMGGEYVFSRLLAGHLDTLQDSEGRDLDILKWDAEGALTGTLKNGYRFRVAETLGTSDAASTVHAVFGNWNQYMVRLKQGAVDSQVFDSGTVVDGSSVSHNLIQQNKVAMRVESWENVGFPIAGAFVRARTAAS